MLNANSISSTFPPVSILKPIKGIEDGMLENLESFNWLDYTNYELILCLSSEKDPAYPLLKSYIESQRNSRVSLHIGEEKVGPNPKVNNLSRPYRIAKNDLLLISDSNVRVTSDYLIKMVQSMSEGVGVVTSVVIGRGAKQLGGDLESVFLNTYYARWMWLCKKFGTPAVVGKSMLFSKKEAERFGGLETLSNYIAEDFMAGQAFEKLGKEVRLCHKPVVQWIGNYKFKDFWNRHLRWGRIRRAQSPLLTLFEPLFFSTVSVWLGVFAIQSFSMPVIIYFMLFHFSLWALCDFFILRAEKTLSWRMLYAWILRELLAFPLFLHTCSSTKVIWRGSQLKIRTGGLVTNL